MNNVAAPLFVPQLSLVLFPARHQLTRPAGGAAQVGPAARTALIGQKWIWKHTAPPTTQRTHEFFMPGSFALSAKYGSPAFSLAHRCDDASIHNHRENHFPG